MNILRLNSLILRRFIRAIAMQFLILAVFVFPLVAEVTRIESASFFVQSVQLSFEELVGASDLTARTIDENLYAALGVSFSCESSSLPSTFRAQYYLLGAFSVTWDMAIRNSTPGSSANEALIIRFQYPVNRVGFRLGNGTADTTATVKAYGLKGDYLGSVERTGVRSPQTIQTLEEIPFLGLESTTPVGTVLLDYGPEPAGEQIHDLYFDYAGGRSFVTYLPQVADGQTGEATIRTLIQVQNPYQMPVPVRIDFVSEGQPLELVVGEERKSSLSFELPVRGSTQIETSGKTSPLGVGYARVESRIPLRTQALFHVKGREGDGLQESGLQSTPPRLFHMIAVEVNRETGLDTGIAIANENGFPVTVGLSLVGPDGQAGGPFGIAGLQTIPPRSQRSFFVTEAFSYLRETEAFTGTVGVYVVSAADGQTLPVAVSGLRTIGGIAISSIPAVGTSE